MKLLITRPLPDTVMTAARARFDVTARAETLPLTPDELRASLRDYDVVLPTLRDLYSAQVFADVPTPRAKLLANFGVGFNHIDVAAARAAGVQVTNTPGAVTDATADISQHIKNSVTNL
jgi:lactate dehydrogenase-like 2-hydroxyacid dehydrogenase